MRFIFNFFFFGVLFYLIWMFFPDAFSTLVSWANHFVAYAKEVIMGLGDKMQGVMPEAGKHPAPVPPASSLLLPMIMRSFK